MFVLKILLMQKRKQLLPPLFISSFYFIYGLVFMVFPRIPLADLFLIEIDNIGAVLMTQYVGLTYICGAMLLYDILRVQNKKSIDICTLILLMIGFFHIYVYLVLDSVWMVYGFIVNMIYAVYMQYNKSIILKND
jgi:hypothetical protein